MGLEGEGGGTNLGERELNCSLQTLPLGAGG